MLLVLHSNTVILLELIRGGLWGTEVSLSNCEDIDCSSVMQLAEEQSVVGLVTAGLERVEDVKIPQQWSLQFIGSTLQLEQRNRAMNDFVASLVGKLRTAGIYTLLVKGQGIAQCYEKPLWRACGDVDFFLDDENYERAKGFLRPLAASVEDEYVREKHLGMTIDPWVVELHGRLYSGLSGRIERELDALQRETFEGGKVRIWKDGETEVPLLAVENDVFYVFTHILQHFYKGGIGLRQICDWCRLLWTYRDTLDVTKVETLVRRMGLVSEWKAFAALAVNDLGMPAEAMPMYDDAAKWSRKAERIKAFVLSVGNFGHNRDMSYYGKYPFLVRKCISMGQRVSDLLNHARIFPLDSLRFFPTMLVNGVRSAVRGEG